MLGLTIQMEDWETNMQPGVVPNQHKQRIGSGPTKGLTREKEKQKVRKDQLRNKISKLKFFKIKELEKPARETPFDKLQEIWSDTAPKL